MPINRNNLHEIEVAPFKNCIFTISCFFRNICKDLCVSTTWLWAISLSKQMKLLNKHWEEEISDCQNECFCNSKTTKQQVSSRGTPHSRGWKKIAELFQIEFNYEISTSTGFSNWKLSYRVTQIKSCNFKWL